MFSFDEEVFSSCSETILLEFGAEVCNRFISHCLWTGCSFVGLHSVELGSLDLSSLLKRVDNALLGPTALSSEITKRAELSVWLQSEYFESLGNNNSLFVVVGEGNTFEYLESLKTCSTSGGLVRKHSTGGFPKESWGSLVVNSVTTGVRIVSFVGDFLSLKDISKEWTWNVDLITANNDDTLSIEKFFSDNTGKTTEHMATTINYNFLFEHA